MTYSRLQYEFEGVMPYQTVLNALLETKRLERMVLYEEDGPNIPLESQELQDDLFKFVSNMPHLACFCFITASEIEAGFLAELKNKFDEFILPIRPAFSITINKSQGQTIKYVGISLKIMCSHPSNSFFRKNKRKKK